MNTFKLTVASPDGNKFCDEITKLDVRGTEGELAVMAGHIPFVSYVKPCDCHVELEDGTVKTASVQGGVLTVSKDSVILLSGELEWK